MSQQQQQQRTDVNTLIESQKKHKAEINDMIEIQKTRNAASPKQTKSSHDFSAEELRSLSSVTMETYNKLTTSFVYFIHLYFLFSIQLLDSFILSV